MKEGMKKKLAAMLSTTMLVTSLSLTSLANIVTDSVIEGDYYLVTLNAGNGVEFQDPSTYDTMGDENESDLPIATSSNVTAFRKVIKKTGKPGTTTQFAVVDSKTLSLGDIKSAAEEADLREPEGATILWLEKKDDLDTEVTDDNNISLTGNKTIYAKYIMSADTDGCTVVEDVTSISNDNVKLTVTDIAENDKLKTSSDLDKAVKEAGKNYTGLNPDNLLQLDIEGPDGKEVLIRITVPDDFYEKRNGKQLFGLHKKGSKWESINPEYVDGEDNVIEFKLTSFSPIVIGYRDGEEINVTLKNVPGGGRNCLFR